MLSGGQENEAQLVDVPSLIDSPIGQVERSVQVSTGMELLDDGSLHILDLVEWNDRRHGANSRPHPDRPTIPENRSNRTEVRLESLTYV